MVQLCSQASGAPCWPQPGIQRPRLLSSHFSEPSPPELSHAPHPTWLLACLSPTCCPFSRNIKEYSCSSVCHPSPHLGLKCSWNSRGLEGSRSHGPGWQTTPTVWEVLAERPEQGRGRAQDTCQPDWVRESPREDPITFSLCRERCPLRCAPERRGCVFVIFDAHKCPGQCPGKKDTTQTRVV